MALLAGVGPLVRRNAALVGEPPGAHRAGVRLLARVRPLVRGNVALLGEPLKKINASGSMQIYPAVHLRDLLAGIAGLGNCLVARALSPPPPPPPIPLNQCWGFGVCMGGWVSCCRSCVVLALHCLHSIDRPILYGKVQGVQPRGLVCALGRGSHPRRWC